MTGEPTTSGMVTGGPRLILRLEGFLVLAAATAAYGSIGTSWGLFAILFLVPDLSMLGYIAGRKAGAVIYNVAHSYGAPICLIAWSLFASASQVSAIGLIWMAHIGFDRALGYGLKYAEGFRASHLGQIGRPRTAA